MSVFEIIKITKLNHEYFTADKLVMTDLEGKPNSLLTDLLRDVVTKIEILLDFEQLDSTQEVITALKGVTPLPDDVLDEYTKILDQSVVGVNFVSKRSELEIVYR
ncbi:hypothetical protein [Xylocopilactobacillus apicola]|uniref:Uncharacterized protein n=1 Tax=Xylocopilactobacillus apicola TaxID=2932184 RepID=A0AAU9D6J1_9LACO|nr:hypothetical protein [Xylocopilactobacillus apicola]BDR59469.1 hypothetical protein XA3_19100 [Xylocopilactobacillus apicola]